MSLREGFTTGSAGTAAAMAAFGRLLGLEFPAAVDCPLPPFAETPGEPPTAAGRLNIPLAAVTLSDGRATAAVIKDGGDDPDATHRARIEAEAELLAPADAAPGGGEILVPGFPLLLLRGGPGVGRVTLPGLPVAVGEPAINPVPRRQIQAGLREVAALRGYKGGVRVTLSVPDGENIARRTLNPRLGITGGISILGTHGTVRPYSHDAWKASILEGLSVARAVNCPRVFLSTGRRSERLLQNIFPLDREQAFVQPAFRRGRGVPRHRVGLLFRQAGQAGAGAGAYPCPCGSAGNGASCPLVRGGRRRRRARAGIRHCLLHHSRSGSGSASAPPRRGRPAPCAGAAGKTRRGILRPGRADRAVPPFHE